VTQHVILAVFNASSSVRKLHGVRAPPVQGDVPNANNVTGGTDRWLKCCLG
jgi:hypothetical protein